MLASTMSVLESLENSFWQETSNVDGDLIGEDGAASQKGKTIW